MRRALPPSAQMTLTPDQDIFSQTIQLPVRGQPSQYPFDDYLLWLGLAGTVGKNGETIELTPELLAQRAVITTQNQLRDFLMAPPVEIDPARVTAPTDPQEFVGVQSPASGVLPTRRSCRSLDPAHRGFGDHGGRHAA